MVRFSAIPVICDILGTYIQDNARRIQIKYSLLLWDIFYIQDMQYVLYKHTLDYQQIEFFRV